MLSGRAVLVSLLLHDRQLALNLHDAPQRRIELMLDLPPTELAHQNLVVHPLDLVAESLLRASQNGLLAREDVRLLHLVGHLFPERGHLMLRGPRFRRHLLQLLLQAGSLQLELLQSLHRRFFLGLAL